MTILALDLATKTGWCAGELSGVQTFDVRRGESPGMRFLRLNAWLEEVCNTLLRGVNLIVYEQAHHRGGAATQCAVGMSTQVMAFAAKYEIELMPVHTATLKKFATGRGNANKDEVIAAARERGYNPQDDNEADAIMLYWYAAETLHTV